MKSYSAMLETLIVEESYCPALGQISLVLGLRQDLRKTSDNQLPSAVNVLC